MSRGEPGPRGLACHVEGQRRHSQSRGTSWYIEKMRAFLVLLMKVARNGYRSVVRNKLERASDLHLRSMNLRDDIL